MSLRKRLQRHRKDSRWITGGLALLLLIATGLFYLLERSRELPPTLVTNRVLLFVLWYVNVVLILTVLFVLLRNLFKLLVERHNRILGSKFKTKLVLTYFGLSLIPVLLLFVISTQLFRGSINRWFSTPLEEILTLGSSVAQELSLTVERQNLSDASRVLTEIELLGLTDPAARSALNQRLRELVQERELDYLAVYEGTELLHAALASQGPLADLPEPGRALLREAAANGRARGQPPAKTEGTLIVGAVSSGEKDTEAPLIVVAGRVLAPAAAASARRLIEAAQGYKQLEVQRDDLKASYLLIFLMLTLLILLAATWVGLYLARRVTVPIQALADGTRRISMGDLDHRVAASADDELGVLVDSFNRMTAELQASKAELERAQRLATWREAARRVAHEIRNPLTPIQLAAERLLAKHRRGDPDFGAALEESVEIIGREVKTLEAMVDEFSRYARLPEPQPERIDLAQLFADTLQLYRNVKPGVEVEGRVAPEVGEVFVDPEQIRRVLINLVDNAIEATSAPGQVRVEARRANGRLRIDVADTGPGIPPEARDKLFLPYFSTKGRGTGLGLAIVHRIVTDHHGRITAGDNEPRGTVFTVELPAEP